MGSHRMKLIFTLKIRLILDLKELYCRINWYLSIFKERTDHNRTQHNCKIRHSFRFHAVRPKISSLLYNFIPVSRQWLRQSKIGIEMAPALGKCESTTWINSQDFSLKKKTLFQLSFKFARKNANILGVVKWSQKSCKGDGYVFSLGKIP